MSATLVSLLMLAASQGAQLTLWHSYTGMEQQALEAVVQRFNKTQKTKVATSAVPFDALADKLTAAIPRGHGPDVFIFAHDRLGGWVEGGLVSPLELFVDEPTLDAHERSCVFALAYGDSLYGLPLAYKNLALYIRTDIIPKPPSTFSALIEIAKAHTEPSKGRYGLVYGNDDFFFHTPFHLGMGGRVFNEAGEVDVVSEGAARALAFARTLAKGERIVPLEPNQAAFGAMFSQGRTPMVISGPWFRSSIDKNTPYTVVPLPAPSQGKASSGFSTCEGVMMSAHTKHPAKAFAFMRFLANDLEAAQERMRIGAQTITLKAARTAAYSMLAPQDANIFKGFQAAFETSSPAPKSPAMAAVWTPMNAALYRVIHQNIDPKVALQDAQSRIDRALKR